MRHEEVVERFLSGRRGTGSSLISDGTDLLYRGNHIPLVAKLDDGSFLMCSSVDYSRHHYSSHMVAAKLRVKGTVFHCTMQEMHDYSRKYPRPSAIVLTKYKGPETIGGAIAAIRGIVRKRNGDSRRFPDRKIETIIEDEIMWHRVLRARDKAWEDKAPILTGALNRSSMKILPKVFDEVCSVLKEYRYNDLNCEQNYEQNLILSLLQSIGSDNKRLKKASKALSKFLPGFKGIAVVDYTIRLVVFGEGRLEIFPVQRVNRKEAIKRCWQRWLAGRLEDPQHIKHTFGPEMANDLIRDAVIENL